MNKELKFVNKYVKGLAFNNPIVMNTLMNILDGVIKCEENTDKYNVTYQEPHWEIIDGTKVLIKPDEQIMLTLKDLAYFNVADALQEGFLNKRDMSKIVYGDYKFLYTNYTKRYIDERTIYNFNKYFDELFMLYGYYVYQALRKILLDKIIYMNLRDIKRIDPTDNKRLKLLNYDIPYYMRKMVMSDLDDTVLYNKLQKLKEYEIKMYGGESKYPIPKLIFDVLMPLIDLNLLDFKWYSPYSDMTNLGHQGEFIPTVTKLKLKKLLLKHKHTLPSFEDMDNMDKCLESVSKYKKYCIMEMLDLIKTIMNTNGLGNFRKYDMPTFRKAISDAKQSMNTKFMGEIEHPTN